MLIAALAAFLLPLATAEVADAMIEDDECQAEGCSINALQQKAIVSSDVADGHIPKHKVWTLYHATGPEIGPKILHEGFRPGNVGWCGGGIYFGNTPAETKKKAVGVHSEQGYLIEVKVKVGNVKKMPWHCLSDVHCLKGNTQHSIAGTLQCLSQESEVEVHRQLQKEGYDSIVFNPGDGNEVVIYDNSQIVSMKHVRMPGQSKADFWKQEAYTKNYLAKHKHEKVNKAEMMKAIPKAKCSDTPGWENPYGYTCSTYEKFCKDGRAQDGKHWTLGKKYNYPERNCCVCGKLYNQMENKWKKTYYSNGR